MFGVVGSTRSTPRSLRLEVTIASSDQGLTWVDELSHTNTSFCAIGVPRRSHYR